MFLLYVKIEWYIHVHRKTYVRVQSPFLVFIHFLKYYTKSPVPGVDLRQRRAAEEISRKIVTYHRPGVCTDKL